MLKCKMRFYLVRDGKAIFHPYLYQLRNNGVHHRSTTVQANASPVNQKSSEAEKCRLVKDFLERENSGDREKTDLLRYDGFWDFGLGIGILDDVSPAKTVQKSFWTLDWVSPRHCLGQLAESFEGAKVKVELTVLKNEKPEAPSMCIVSTKDAVLSRDAKPEFESLNMYPANVLKGWKNPKGYVDSRVTVTVTIPDDLFDNHFGHLLGPLNRKILEGEVLSDVTIRCGDGIQVKANRCILAARSSVLLTMFGKDMKRGKESTVEFPNMMARSVQAFLKYLYCSDMSDAEKDLKVASDLFNIAQKYSLSFLETKMMELIQKESPARKKIKTEKVDNEEPVNRRILKDAVLSDVTILCGNGAEVKANWCFLAVRSSVFRAMFETDMEESRTSTLEIPDMEEKSVRAFLKYLYLNDRQYAKNDFNVAFDLLQAGHKYDITCLEEKMRELILNKQNNWFDVNGAVKLFMFARNLTPVDEELKTKAIGALSLYAGSLEKSPLIQELFLTDFMAVMEILKCALQHYSAEFEPFETKG